MQGTQVWSLVGELSSHLCTEKERYQRPREFHPNLSVKSCSLLDSDPLRGLLALNLPRSRHGYELWAKVCPNPSTVPSEKQDYTGWHMIKRKSPPAVNEVSLFDAITSIFLAEVPVNDTGVEVWEAVLFVHKSKLVWQWKELPFSSV